MKKVMKAPTMKVLKNSSGLAIMKKKAMMKMVMSKKTKTPSIGSRRQVWGGYATKTSGGLRKGDLMLNKNGKLVSKRKSKAMKGRHFNTVTRWAECLKIAYKKLNFKGFVPC